MATPVFDGAAESEIKDLLELAGYPESGQLVGFIGAMTNFHFCESCNKLRLTSDGKLRPCLGSHLEFDLLKEMRRGADDSEVAAFIREVVDRKPKEHEFRDNYVPNRDAFP